MFHRHDWKTTYEKISLMTFTNVFHGLQHEKMVNVVVQTCKTCDKSRAYWTDMIGKKGKLSPEFMKQIISK